MQKRIGWNPIFPFHRMISNKRVDAVYTQTSQSFDDSMKTGNGRPLICFRFYFTPPLFKCLWFWFYIVPVMILHKI